MDCAEVSVWKESKLCDELIVLKGAKVEVDVYQVCLNSRHPFDRVVGA